MDKEETSDQEEVTTPEEISWVKDNMDQEDSEETETQGRGLRLSKLA